MFERCVTAVYLLFVSVLSASAQTVDVNTSTDNGSPNDTIISQQFSTTYPNELLLVCISADSSTSPDTVVRSVANTGTALTWALVKRTGLTRHSNGQLGTAELWAATATSQVTGITVTATLSESVAASMTILGFPSGSIGATGTGNADPGAPTASLTTTANGSLVVGVGDDFDDAIARTVDPAQTLIHQYLAPVQDTYWVQMLTSPVPLSGTTVTIGDTVPTTDRFNMSIAEIVFGQAAPPPTTYSITGTVGIGSATVALSGTASASTFADSSGTFTFSNLVNGSYSVTPSLAGYTFSPTSQNATIDGTNVTGMSFTAKAQQPRTYSISGMIAGSSGATVALSGASSATTTTTNSGVFTFSALANGSYTVTPSEAGFTFAPTSVAISINGANATGVNFTVNTSAATYYSIGGTITPAAVSSGVTVTLSGAGTASTTVGSDGSFSFTSLVAGTYTVTPSSISVTFNPGSQTITVNNANATGINFTAASASPSGCGDRLNWTDAICQQIGSGALNPQWTVISRHGEYAQSETECNIPTAISQTPGELSITMTSSSSTCGDFSPTTGAACPSTGCDTSGGNVSPATWPYRTGDIQWNTFNICPSCSVTTYPTATPCGGTCTITVVGSMPSFNTGTWPAFWLLGQQCQSSNKYTGDTGVETCPYEGESGYREIDTTECYGGENTWCQFHVANPSFGIGNGCDAIYSVSTGQHTFQTIWTPDSIRQYMDGTLETTCNQSINGPMFFIAQIQSASSSGMVPDNANLPAVMTLNSVTVTDANGNTLFSDDFPNQN
jgi:hypothetical protein